MILDELATHIDAQTTLTQGTDLFKGDMPDAPDACAALFETPGASTPASLADTVELRSVQVRSRALKYPDAQTRCEEVYRLLHGVAETTLSGARFVLIEAKQPPFSLGEDGKQRHLFAVNFRVLYDNPDR